MTEAAISTTAPAVSDSDLRKLNHMLGIDNATPAAKWGYRNHFATCPGSPDHECMQRLMAAGLVRQGQQAPKMFFYHATETGCRAAGLTEVGIKRALGE